MPCLAGKNEQIPLSNDTTDSVLQHWEVRRSKDLSAPPPKDSTQLFIPVIDIYFYGGFYFIVNLSFVTPYKPVRSTDVSDPDVWQWDQFFIPWRQRQVFPTVDLNASRSCIVLACTEAAVHCRSCSFQLMRSNQRLPMPDMSAMLSQWRGTLMKKCLTYGLLC